MIDTDTWRQANVHWHAYIESPGQFAHSDRPTRLARTPDEAFTEPDSAAAWVAEMTRKHASQQPVKTDDRWGRIGDETHVQANYDQDLHMLSCGNSLYADVKTPGDRLCLWLEAVTPDHCQQMHWSRAPVQRF